MQSEAHIAMAANQPATQALAHLAALGPQAAARGGGRPGGGLAVVTAHGVCSGHEIILTLGASRLIHGVGHSARGIHNLLRRGAKGRGGKRQMAGCQGLEGCR